MTSIFLRKLKPETLQISHTALNMEGWESQTFTTIKNITPFHLSWGVSADVLKLLVDSFQSHFLYYGASWTGWSNLISLGGCWTPWLGQAWAGFDRRLDLARRRLNNRSKNYFSRFLINPTISISSSGPNILSERESYFLPLSLPSSRLTMRPRSCFMRISLNRSKSEREARLAALAKAEAMGVAAHASLMPAAAHAYTIYNDFSNF